MKYMDENFKKLKERVKDSLENTDIEYINYELSKLNGNTLVAGVGGSHVVSEFASRILEYKNNILVENVEPRDVKYMKLKLYKNILLCSYSGNNFASNLSFTNELKKYLLSSNKSEMECVTNLTYKCNDREKSFISLASTLIPCSIMLNYYENNKFNMLDEIHEYNFSFDTAKDVYEIFTGRETEALSTYLESTMTESGIAIPVIHDKYEYCHGRSTLGTKVKSNAIFLNTNKELDRVLLENIKGNYNEIIVIDTDETLEKEYSALIECMHLTKYIAENKNTDLSKVVYSKFNKNLYKYRGEVWHI